MIFFRTASHQLICHWCQVESYFVVTSLTSRNNQTETGSKQTDRQTDRKIDKEQHMQQRYPSNPATHLHRCNGNITFISSEATLRDGDKVPSTSKRQIVCRSRFPSPAASPGPMLQRAQMAKELRQRESFNRPKRSKRANALDAISISFLVFLPLLLFK